MEDTVYILLLFYQVVIGIPVFDELPSHQHASEGDQQGHAEHAYELQGIQPFGL